MKSPILGSFYVNRSVNSADNNCINLYPEIVPEGGKEPAYLQRAPGLRILNTIGSGPIRGMWNMNGRAFVVSGLNFYELYSDWTYRLIGQVDGTDPVSMSDNGTQIFIACNPAGFIYSATSDTVQRIQDPDFPGAVTVGFIDGYFVFNEPNSQRFWVTALYDGADIDTLDFASAEGSPDNLVSLIVDHREVWLFGQNSVEVWYNAGTLDFPLERIQGAYNEIGCAAPYSVAKLDNTLFWLGSDARGRGIVYKANGYTGQRVSTHAIEFYIQQYDDISTAVGYTYQQDGHAFYVLNFPSGNATWVYDVATQTWHRRGQWADTHFDRHRSNCQVSFNNEIVVGDYQNGKIYAFDLDYYQDDGQVQRWLRSWRALPTGENTLRRTTQHSLQLDCQTGVGLPSVNYEYLNSQFLAAENGYDIITEDGANILTEFSYVGAQDPQVMLRWSDDGGHTWSNEHWKSIGPIGRYGTRTIWRRLGMTLKIRDRVYEISGTDPVKIAIMGAELILSPTNA